MANYCQNLLSMLVSSVLHLWVAVMILGMCMVLLFESTLYHQGLYCRTEGSRELFVTSPCNQNQTTLVTTVNSFPAHTWFHCKVFSPCMIMTESQKRRRPSVYNMNPVARVNSTLGTITFVNSSLADCYQDLNWAGNTTIEHQSKLWLGKCQIEKEQLFLRIIMSIVMAFIGLGIGIVGLVTCYMTCSSCVDLMVEPDRE